jgi:hypothetical protein
MPSYNTLETLIIQLHATAGAMRRNLEQWGYTPNSAQLERVMSLAGQMEDHLKARDYRLDLTVQLSDSLREDAAKSGESLEERALRFAATRPLTSHRRAVRMEEISIHSKAAIRRLREEEMARLEEPAPCDPGIPGFTPSID